MLLDCVRAEAKIGQATGELKYGHRNRWFIFATDFAIDGRPNQSSQTTRMWTNGDDSGLRGCGLCADDCRPDLR